MIQSKKLDCKNLKCPMPIVQIAMAIKGMKAGEELLVEATDRAFLADAQAWSRMTGHELMDVTDAAVEGTLKQVLIRKVESS